MICVEYFFPKYPVQSDFVSARQLRRGIIPLVVAHILIACLGMAFISILTFAAQFMYTAILYSIYMNLRPWIIYMYMTLLGFNVISGLFSLFLYQGPTFAVYLIILICYTFMIIKIKQDSSPFRNMSDLEENPSNFYLAEGIKHMVNTAREEYPYGRRVLGDGQNQNQQVPQIQNLNQNEQIPQGRNARAPDDYYDPQQYDVYGEPLLQNHYLAQMRERDQNNNNNNRVGAGQQQPLQQQLQQNQQGVINQLRPVAELGMPLIRALGAQIQQQYQQQQRQRDSIQQNQQNVQGRNGRLDMMDRMYEEYKNDRR